MGVELNPRPFCFLGERKRALKLRQRFTFKLSVQDRQVLDQLAAEEGERASALIRRLIRLEARCRGLWPLRPESSHQQDVKNSEQ